MNQEYKHTRFLACPPAGGLPIRFGVVTACNPKGLATDEAQNVAATEKLRQQLQDAGRIFFPVTGCSPDLAHSEPGFGLACETAEEVVELGRTWHQQAVFWVEDDIVRLLPCGAGECAALGAWPTLADSHPGGPLANDPSAKRL